MNVASPSAAATGPDDQREDARPRAPTAGHIVLHGARRARCMRSVCDAVCHSSRLRRRDEEPPQRAHDRVGRDPRLVRQEGDGERHLLRRWSPRPAPPPRSRRATTCRAADGAARAAARRSTARRSASRPSSVQRSGEPGQHGPAGDQERELRDLDRAAAQVVEDLPAREQRAAGCAPARRAPARAGCSQSRQLPVAADPAVLAAGVGEVARRVVVVDHDVGGEPGARVAAFDQVVREQRVLGKAAVRWPARTRRRRRSPCR